jgi:uncharacterized membrane protein YbhN (UPF0104 family)
MTLLRVTYAFLMQRKRSLLGPLLGLTLLLIAVFVLVNKLGTLDLKEVRLELIHTPISRTICALLLTVGYYILATGYDTLAFRVISTPFKYSRIALASFTGYAFGHNVGLSALSGGSVRYRIHSSFGLPVKETAKVVAFCALSFWVGALTMSSLVFLFIPRRIPFALHLPFRTAQPIGWISLALLIIYFFIVTRALHGRKIGSFNLPYLKPKQVFLQMAVGSGDLLIGASILFLLLPHVRVMGFFHFFQAYMLAYIAGLTSQVPGGFGVFEGILLLLIPKAKSAAVTVSALIMFRLIFYVLPLIVAVFLLAAHEIRVGRREFGHQTNGQ